MKIKHGKGSSKYGPGVDIKLTSEEVAIAINSYLCAHQVYVFGPCTTTVNGEMISKGRVYVDPSGYVIHDGKKIDGRGPDEDLHV